MKRLDYDLYEGKYTEVHNKDNNNLFVEGDIENGQIKSIKSITDHEGNVVAETVPELDIIVNYPEPNVEYISEFDPATDDVDCYIVLSFSENKNGKYVFDFKKGAEGEGSVFCSVTINFKKGDFFTFDAGYDEDYKMYKATFKQDWSFKGKEDIEVISYGNDTSYTIPNEVLDIVEES